MSDYKVSTTTANSGCITINSDSNTLTSTDAYTIDPKYYEWTTANLGTAYGTPNNKKGGDEDMRYLYEVFLVNPKNDTCFADKIIARSETSALMKTYHNSEYDGNIDFDDLKISCRVLIQWKKKQS